MSKIQAVLNEFMPCGGDICPGCEEACTSGDGRTPDADRMADAIIDLRAEREALRKDAARLDAIESGEVHIECMGMTLRHMNVYSKHGKCVTSGLFGTQLSLTFRQAIDAALAVQPTTGGGDE